MSILIGVLEFEGPYTDFDLLSNVSGLYVLLYKNGCEYDLLEMGESGSIRHDMQAHPDRAAWDQQGLDLAIAVHYTNDLTPSERKDVRDTLEREFELAA